MVEETPEEIRLRLAAKIPEVFDLTTKPSWCRTPKIANETLKEWTRKGTYFYFAEEAKPIILHRHYEDIPFDALRYVEPFFWASQPDIEDYKYMLAVNLRAMLFAKKEMDTAFDGWMSQLMRHMYLPEDLRKDRKQFIYGSTWWRAPSAQSLEKSSQFLHNFTLEQRQFMAEFFREFYAMFPYEEEYSYPTAIQIAENFWDGIYLKDG